MKAIVASKYGSPNVLQLREVTKPFPKANEALVKIHASSVNSADLEALRGDFAVRMAGPLRPNHKIPGTDLAGRIEAVGRNVTRFHPGDEIWGDLSYPLHYSAFAEYVCVPESSLRLKPPNLTFKEAAAVPTAAVVALQNLRDKREIQPGQKVLINGAGGGVGTFAVQFAKFFGAEVTGVDSAKKLEMLRSIGADHVIDYQREDFTRSGKQYDLILDVVVQRSNRAYRRVLSPQGMVVMIGGNLSRVFLNLAFSMLGKKDIGLVPWRPNDEKDLAFIQELIADGKVKPVIDREYPLEEVPDALLYLKQGQSLGKVVITIVN